ncbi:MAG: response regulator [Leptospira sp.]|nr:response regulator [Leptospira sp.]
MNRPLNSVLIVEDEEDIIEILKIAIEFNSNILLSYATNGEVGLRIAKQNMPDLILLDVLMPGMDGLQMIDELKSDPKIGSIPVIFLTSRVQRSELLDYKKRGAIGVIEKPFAPLEITSRIHSIWEEFNRK